MIYKPTDNLIRFWYDGKVIRKCDRAFGTMEKLFANAIEKKL